MEFKRVPTKVGGGNINNFKRVQTKVGTGNYTSYEHKAPTQQKESSISKLLNIPNVVSKKYLSSFSSGMLGSISATAGFGEMLSSKIGWQGGVKSFDVTESKLSEWAAAVAPEEQNFAQKVAGGFGSMTTYLFPGIGVAKGASILGKVSPTVAKIFGGSAMTALESASEAGSVYEENQRMGKSEQEAMSAGEKTFGANVVLNAVTNRFLLGAGGKSFIKSSLRGFSSESIQEASQSIISNSFTDRPALEGALESGLIGGIVGGSIGIMQVTPQNRSKVKEDIKTKLGVTPSVAEEVVKSIEVSQKKFKVVRTVDGISLKPKTEDTRPFVDNITKKVKVGQSFLDKLSTPISTETSPTSIFENPDIVEFGGETNVKPTKESILEKMKVKTKPEIKIKSEIDQYIDFQRKYQKEHPMYRDSEQQGKFMKGEAMKYAALKRKLNGVPTGKEINSTLKYLNSNYIGKRVSVNGKVGTVEGVAWGKIKVKTNDGNTGLYDKENIKYNEAKEEDAIDYLKEQAKKEFQAEKNSISGKGFVYRTSPKPTQSQNILNIIRNPKPAIQEIIVEKPPIKRVTNEPQKESGISKRIKERAREMGQTVDETDETVKYSSGNKKDQNTRIDKLMKEDIEKAKRIATGKEEAPSGIRAESLFTKMQEYAEKTKDGVLALELAKSPIASEISQAGSTLSMSNMLSKDSAIGRINELLKLKEKKVEELLKGKTKAKAKQEIKEGLKEKLEKNNVTQKSLFDFINDIKC